MKKVSLLILLLLSMLLLAGCSLALSANQQQAISVEPKQNPGSDPVKPSDPVTPPAVSDLVPAQPGTPSPAIPAFYTVKAGDTLHSIAGQFALPEAFVAANNGLGSSGLVKVGQSLRLQSRDAKLQIDVNLAEQTVRILEGEQVLREMICSGGMVGHETPTGTFYVQNRGDWFFSARYQEGGEWWVSFRDWGVYLFHSVPMDANKQVITEEADRLGQPASHGCVRLAIDDAKWIYDHVPAGTKVVIH